MKATHISLDLPRWLAAVDPSGLYPTPEDKVRLAVDLARRNVAEATGGPFGAAVFERETGELIAAGVNLVVPAHASIAHAEMIALTLAQQRLQTHDLSGIACDLATSTEPCAMCLGAVPWSGVSRLLCGARDEDARAVGFDEGAKPANWVKELTSRGIEVVRDILRDDARSVLVEYGQSGGTIYNPRR